MLRSVLCAFISKIADFRRDKMPELQLTSCWRQQPFPQPAGIIGWRRGDILADGVRFQARVFIHPIWLGREKSHHRRTDDAIVTSSGQQSATWHVGTRQQQQQVPLPSTAVLLSTVSGSSYCAVLYYKNHFQKKVTILYYLLQPYYSVLRPFSCAIQNT